MAKAKKIIGLDCSSDATESAAKILRLRFEEITELYKPSSDFSDVDLIHDLRVATRRLRSALRDFMPLLEKVDFKQIKKELKRLADSMGKVRDQDVAIEALEKLRSEAENEIIKEHIGFFMQERKDLREAARLELAEIFTTEKIEDLRRVFSEKLDEAVNSKDSAQNVSFKEFGQTVIGRNLQEFCDLTDSLYEPYEIEKLHRLRIHAKRLRYALKIFAACWENECKNFAKKIAKMQSFLGDTHDCDEWIAKLFLLLREENVEKDKRETLIWLLSRFFESRNQEFTSAMKLWSDWQSDYFLARLKAMTL